MWCFYFLLSLREHPLLSLPARVYAVTISQLKSLIISPFLNLLTSDDQRWTLCPGRHIFCLFSSFIDWHFNQGHFFQHTTCQQPGVAAVTSTIWPTFVGWDVSILTPLTLKKHVFFFNSLLFRLTQHFTSGSQFRKRMDYSFYPLLWPFSVQCWFL